MDYCFMVSIVTNMSVERRFYSTIYIVHNNLRGFPCHKILTICSGGFFNCIVMLLYYIQCFYKKYEKEGVLCSTNKLVKLF